MKFVRKCGLLSIFASLLILVSSCGPGKKIKGWDCGCWSHDVKVKKQANEEPERS